MVSDIPGDSEPIGLYRARAEMHRARSFLSLHDSRLGPPDLPTSNWHAKQAARYAAILRRLQWVPRRAT